MWIYEDKRWPNFVWNEKEISSKLADVRHKQGLLLGKMAVVGFDLKQEATLSNLTHDAVKSSAIEGEALKSDEVRSSIAKRLGIDAGGLVSVSRDVEGMVEMLLDATQKASSVLTKERLFDWHAALFPTGRSGMHKITVGAWRTQSSGPMQVVSGAYGKENIHFEAPLATVLPKEMKAFLDWFDSEADIDPVLKAGIAHLWFVTIHPFEDGNGRIARAIADMLLARADNTTDRFYSLSSQISKERKDYYLALEHQQKSDVDITRWLVWFLDCLGRALDVADASFSNTLERASFWQLIETHAINVRQRNIIRRMLEDGFEGHMNTSKYAKMAKCSSDTALRDIRELLALDIFIQNEGGGRSTSYRLAR